MRLLGDDPLGGKWSCGHVLAPKWKSARTTNGACLEQPYGEVLPGTETLGECTDPVERSKATLLPVFQITQGDCTPATEKD